MSIAVVAENIQQQFEVLKGLVERRSGHVFRSFAEGLPHTREGYKAGLRERALELMSPSTWTAEQVGTGSILEAVISAIELDDRERDLKNNFVTWDARYGHAAKYHGALLEARRQHHKRAPLERWLLEFFQIRLRSPPHSRLCEHFRETSITTGKALSGNQKQLQSSCAS
jgi:hypothetical protein